MRGLKRFLGFPVCGVFRGGAGFLFQSLASQNLGNYNLCVVCSLLSVRAITVSFRKKQRTLGLPERTRKHPLKLCDTQNTLHTTQKRPSLTLHHIYVFEHMCMCMCMCIVDK